MDEIVVKVEGGMVTDVVFPEGLVIVSCVRVRDVDTGSEEVHEADRTGRTNEYVLIRGDG